MELIIISYYPFPFECTNNRANMSSAPSLNSKHYTNKCVSFSAPTRSRDKTEHLQYAPQIDRPKAIKQATDEPKWSETHRKAAGGISDPNPRHQNNHSPAQTLCDTALLDSVNSHAVLRLWTEPGLEFLCSGEWGHWLHVTSTNAPDLFPYDTFE
jgi:hypothetical protein